MKTALRFSPLMLWAVALAPNRGWACAACYGQSDSPLAAGMNWGIFSLLGFIVLVLGGVAAFFIFLARRSAAVAAVGPRPQPDQAVLVDFDERKDREIFERLADRRGLGLPAPRHRCSVQRAAEGREAGAHRC